MERGVKDGMLREIGSYFWLSPEDNLDGQGEITLSALGLTGEDSVFLSTGRGAEDYVLKEIQKRNPDAARIALIPPYTCKTVIAPFVQHGYEIHTYLVDEGLRTTPEMLAQSVEQSNASVVLLHNYFGFHTLAGCSDVIRTYAQKGVVFIEDRTQCVFSTFDTLPADYFVGSLRKWAAVPDGGYAVCKEGRFADKPSSYDRTLTEAKIRASIAKYQYLFHGVGEKAAFLEMCNAAERILDEEAAFYAISPVSKSVFSGLDVSALKEKRRQNYQMLYEALAHNPGMKIVMGELTDETVPLYFMLRTECRKELQAHLIENQIYAPIVWPRADEQISVCNEAEMLYAQALCIPIDQRYDLADMERIVKCIAEFYGNNSSINDPPRG